MSFAGCQVLNTLTPFPEVFQGGVVTIGKFDGVHLGHVEILHRTVEHARRLGVPSIAVTFDPPPLELLRPHFAPPPLCSLLRKIELIADEQLDGICVVPTTRELLAMDAQTFFEQIVRETFHARGVVEGDTFTFGKGRTGNAELLRSLGKAAGMEIEIVPALKIEDRPVSSSRLRHLIKEGELEEASRLMLRPYRITGTVVHGARRGRTLGFPTANLDGIETLLPKPGLYAGRVPFGDTVYPAAVHIGPVPTFGLSRPVVEAHLLDFGGTLYGETISVDLFTLIRGIVKFENVEDLIAQMQADIRVIRQRFGSLQTPRTIASEKSN